MEETKDTWRAVVELAGRHYGVVTRAQVLAAGGSPEWIRRRVVARELLKFGWRVYVVPAAPRSWEQLALAACLDFGSDAVLSHMTAACAWRLLPPGDEIHVTVPIGRTSRGRESRPRTCGGDLVVHRSRRLVARDRTVIGKLPVTTSARTIIDLSSSVRGEALAALLDRAFCQQVVTPARVAAAIERAEPRGRRGIVELRQLLAPWLDGRPVESVAEGVVRRALARAGLPEPVTQHRVKLDSGTTVRLDFAWPDRLVALEVDSYRWHSDPKSFSEDLARANRLAALGWTVLRTTSTEFAEQGTAVITALARHLHVRA